MRPAKYDKARFVKEWQLCESVAEVASRMGMSAAYARVMASSLRTAGVPLKQYHRGKADIGELIRIAQEHA